MILHQMKKIVFLLGLLTTSLFAQTTDSLFYEANDLYKNGAFEDAIKKYEAILEKDLVSAELYYNLGNSYYKLNKVGPTIYYYEKALKIDPTNADVKNNLIFAKRLALDNIEEVPKTVFQKINSNFLQKLTFNEWAVVSVVLSFVAVLLFFLFYFANATTKKRLFFTCSMLSFLALIFTLVITYQQYQFFNKNKEAIIFAEETVIRNAPTVNSEEVFTLHEGTKVMVLDALDNWKKIKIADGKLGWIISDELKIID